MIIGDIASNTVYNGYHCTRQIHYHIVFPARNRKALIDEQVTESIKDTVSVIIERYIIDMEALGCYKDHIHLKYGAQPKFAPRRIVQILKNIAAREIFRLVEAHLSSKAWHLLKTMRLAVHYL